jgi:hypothetical protein
MFEGHGGKKARSYVATVLAGSGNMFTVAADRKLKTVSVHLWMEVQA